VLLLQALYDYSDPQVVEALRCDIRWKVACGLPLTNAGFDPSTLVYWRKRLAASACPHRINDAIDQVIGQTGVLKGRRKRALDSTILADAVATQDTVTQLIAAIRRVGRQVPGAAAAIAAECSGADYSTPAKPKIDWEDPQAREELGSGLVNDAAHLVEMFTAEQVKLTGKQTDAVGLLALAAGQDVEPAEGSDGRWRIARRVATGRVISVNDPQARHTRKTPEARRDGYRAHIAAEPGTTLITGCALTQATGSANSDAAVAEQIAGRRARTSDRLRRLSVWHQRATRRHAGGRTHPDHQTQTPQTRHQKRPHPWTTSPPTRQPAPSPARATSPARPLPNTTSPSGPPAGPTHYGTTAPPTRPTGP